MRHPIRSVLRTLALLYPLVLLVLTAQQLGWPQRVGLLALLQVGAPYLFLPLLGLGPLALLGRGTGVGLLRGLLLLCVVVFGLRFSPRLLEAAPAAAPPARTITMLNWNVYMGGVPAQIHDVLTTHPADIVALEECAWTGLAADPAIAQRYPYRVVATPHAPLSLVVLSAYPIRAHQETETLPGYPAVPRVIRAQIDLGGGQQVTVVAGHPPSPPHSFHSCPRAACYMTANRDQSITEIRALAEPALRAGTPLVLLGDFNLTEREPAYAELSAGLQDAYRTVGPGAGHTWPRLILFDQVLPLLRIDYLFSSPAVTPLQATVDCAPRSSDHCALRGTFAIR